MACRVPSGLPLLLPSFLFLTVGVKAASATLNVDGVVRTRGVPFLGAQLVIVDGQGSAELVTSGLEHFRRVLPLGSTFLFEFSRPGCVTKQLYFDTKVPPEAMGSAPFTFPFQVTLEPPPKGQQFEYAGPVGYIRYYPERGDFDYDTDYSRKADPEIVEHMRVARSALTGPTNVPLPPALTLSVPVPSSTPDTSAFPSDEKPDATGPPLIHPTGRSTIPIAMAAGEADLPAPVAMEALDKPQPVTTPPAVLATASERSAPDLFPSRIERSEEVIKSDRWTVLLVRITRDGYTTEYRRVQQHYGAVYYFKGGQSCSEWLFQRETHP